LTQVSVVAGPASIELARNIATGLGAQLSVAQLRIFADGESKIRLDNIRKNCIIVQSTYPPTDTHLIQLMMIAKKCTDDGVEDVCAVIPYLGYARQDRAFLEGETASIALMAKLFETVCIKHIVTVDIHSELALSYFASIQNVSSIPFLAGYAQKMNLREPIAVSPDAGGVIRAKEFAKRLNLDMLALEKSRDRATGEVTMKENLDIDMSRRDVILIDDMISSGNSIVKAAELLRKKGIYNIYAMCAHALLIGNAAQKIKSAGVQDIISTNSISSEYAKVEISPAIISALQSRY